MDVPGMDDPCVLLRECGLIPSGWQLVVAAGPPSGVRLYSSGVRRRGWFLFAGGAGVSPVGVSIHIQARRRGGF